MRTDQFEHVVEEQIKRSTSVLIDKAKEYASDTDRLANFKTAAELQGCTHAQALGGMMAKHTQSIYAMIASGKSYSDAMWNEKIGDHINYLLLLRAVVQEGQNEALSAQAPRLPQIVTASRAEAEGTLEHLRAESAAGVQESYSLTDLCNRLGIPSGGDDSEWGWDNFDDFFVTPAGTGFALYLPPVRLLRVPKGQLPVPPALGPENADKNALDDIAAVIAKGLGWDDESQAVQQIVEQVRRIPFEEDVTPPVESSDRSWIAVDIGPIRRHVFQQRQDAMDVGNLIRASLEANGQVSVGYVKAAYNLEVGEKDGRMGWKADASFYVEDTTDGGSKIVFPDPVRIDAP